MDEAAKFAHAEEQGIKKGIEKGIEEGKKPSVYNWYVVCIKTECL